MVSSTRVNSTKTKSNGQRYTGLEWQSRSLQTVLELVVEYSYICVAMVPVVNISISQVK